MTPKRLIEVTDEINHTLTQEEINKANYVKQILSAPRQDFNDESDKTSWKASKVVLFPPQDEVTACAARQALNIKPDQRGSAHRKLQ